MSAPRRHFADLRRPAEFGSHHDERRLEQAPLMQVTEQSRKGLIGRRRHPLHRDELVVVRVPVLIVFNFDESHAVFDESSGKQATLSERMQSIRFLRLHALLRDVEGLQILALHQLNCLGVDFVVGGRRSIGRPLQKIAPQGLGQLRAPREVHCSDVAT